MKRSKEIIDSPVISIVDGIQIGSIKDAVVNPQQKTVEFLLMDEKGSQGKLRGIPFRAAEGIGDFAVTVENTSVIVDMAKIGTLQELVQKDISVLGTKIITKKGKYLGDVTEYSFDTSTGSIIEFYCNDGDKEVSIKTEQVITVGKEVLIVEDGAEREAESEAEKPEESKNEEDEEVDLPLEVEETDASAEETQEAGESDNLEETVESDESSEVEPEPEPEPSESEEQDEPIDLNVESDLQESPLEEETVDVGALDDETESDSPEEIAPDDMDILAEGLDLEAEEDLDLAEEIKADESLEDELDLEGESEVLGDDVLAELTSDDLEAEDTELPSEDLAENSSDNSEQEYISKQKAFLIGKTLSQDIETDDGEVIAAQGQVVTEELFESVYNLGVQKIMKMAMSVEG